MSDRDPARLFDALEVDDGFKAALREAVDPGPNPEQMRRMAARLGVVPAPGADALVSVSTGRTFWMRGLLLTLPLAAGVWWWSQLIVAHDEPAPRARETSASPVPALEITPPMEEPVEPASVAALPARPSAPRRAQTVRPKRAAEPEHHSAAAGSNPLAELALLRGARAALRSAPERALRLTEQHRREYGRGLLAEERELLATEALMNLGRVGEAGARGRAFERTFPNSAHTRRLHVILSGATP